MKIESLEPMDHGKMRLGELYGFQPADVELRMRADSLGISACWVKKVAALEDLLVTGEEYRLEFGFWYNHKAYTCGSSIKAYNRVFQGMEIATGRAVSDDVKEKRSTPLKLKLA